MQSANADERWGLDAAHRRVVLLLIIIPTVLLLLGVYFGVMQALARAGWITSGASFGIDYYRGLTLHGVVNALVFTTLFEVAFGYVVVAYYLRCSFHAVVTCLAFTLMLSGTLMAAYAMISGSATVLYTFYPPLKASPLFYIGAALLVVGSWIPFFQWIPAYLGWRARNPARKTPLAVVGILATFTIWLIATLPLAFEVIVQLIPWSLGLIPTVNIVLARTLFWFFGHPLVYFWLLPAYVMFYVTLPELAGGKLYSDPAARLAFMLFIVLSAPVGVHHQFADPGISAGYKWLHGGLTYLVALPSFMTAFTLFASLEYAARSRGETGMLSWWRALPYFDRERYLFAYFMAGLILFTFGGITGIVNASVVMNSVVHNTAWIPGHFHTTVGGPVFLGFLGMSLFLVTELTGKQLRLSRVNVAVPYLWTAGVLIFSIGFSVSGLMGAPRRTDMGPTFSNPDSPLYEAGWLIWSHMGAIGAVIMGLAMVLFFAVFFATLVSPTRREPGLRIPTAEAYHDTDPAFVRNFTPWVIAAIVLLVIAYAPPLYEAVTGPSEGAPPYSPSSPVAESAR